MEKITSFIKPELLVLTVVLYFIGIALKKSSIKDKFIPFILGAAGIALSLVWVLASCPLGTWREVLLAVFTAAVQGILVAGASVYISQMKIQKGKDTKSDEEGL